MRVGILTTSFPLQKGSVSGIFILRLIRNFPNRIRTTVITPSGTEPAQVAAAGYTLSCFQYAPRRWQLLAHQPGGIPVAIKNHRHLLLLLPLFLLSMLVSCIRIGRKVDVMHANWSISGFVAGLAGLITGTPVVTTLRGEDMTRSAHSVLDRLVLYGCLHLNSRIVTVSNALANTLKKQFPHQAHKVVMIPNGVGEDLLQIAHATTSLANDKLRLTTIGSLIPRKGVEQIIKALSLIDHRHKIELTIIGDGPERDRLETLAHDSGLDHQVRFIGAVAPNEIINHFFETDALVLASYSEGRPNVVLEALAAGIPVIASNIEGVNELVQDGINGLLFPVGDHQQLAQRIIRLATDPALRRDLGRAARRFIIDNGLLWSETAKRYEDLYHSVAGRGELYSIERTGSR